MAPGRDRLYNQLVGAEVAILGSREGVLLDAREGELVARYGSGSELWRQEGLFVLVMRGRFMADELQQAIERMYGLVDPPDTVLFVEGHDLIVYDRSVLTFYERDVKRAMPRRVGAVIRKPLFRMVVRATALGFRLVTGRDLEVFETLEEALA